MVRVVVIVSLALASFVFFANAATEDATLRFLEPRVEKDPLDFIAWNKLCDHYLKLLRLTGNNEIGRASCRERV